MSLENAAGDPVSESSEGCQCDGLHIVESDDGARNCTRCLPALVAAAKLAQYFGGGDLARYLEPPLLNRAQEIGLLK